MRGLVPSGPLFYNFLRVIKNLEGLLVNPFFFLLISCSSMNQICCLFFQWVVRAPNHTYPISVELISYHPNLKENDPLATVMDCTSYHCLHPHLVQSNSTQTPTMIKCRRAWVTSGLKTEVVVKISRRRGRIWLSRRCQKGPLPSLPQSRMPWLTCGSWWRD